MSVSCPPFMTVASMQHRRHFQVRAGRGDTNFILLSFASGTNLATPELIQVGLVDGLALPLPSAAFDPLPHEGWRPPVRDCGRRPRWCSA